MKKSFCLSLSRFALSGLTIALVLSAAASVRADDITLDVSATFTPVAPPSSCSSSGCTLGGSFTFDNSSGKVVSADVTASGFSSSISPISLGPFNEVAAQVGFPGLTGVELHDANFDVLDLTFATPTAGSLSGYTGGQLSTASTVNDFGTDLWTFESGSLTEAPTSAAEPGSFLLLGSALLAGLWLARKRMFACRA